MSEDKVLNTQQVWDTILKLLLTGKASLSYSGAHFSKQQSKSDWMEELNSKRLSPVAIHWTKVLTSLVGDGWMME